MHNDPARGVAARGEETATPTSPKGKLVQKGGDTAK